MKSLRILALLELALPATEVDWFAGRGNHYVAVNAGANTNRGGCWIRRLLERIVHWIGRCRLLKGNGIFELQSF